MNTQPPQPIAGDPPHPHRPAIIGDDGTSISFRELDERTNQFTHFIRSLNLGPQDVIAVLMDNDLHFYEVVGGAVRSGAAHTTVSYELPEASITHILRDSQAKVLVTTASLARLAEAVTAGELPHLKHRLMIMPSAGRLQSPPPAGFDDFAHVVRAMPVDAATSTPQTGPILMYTSGSTGRPKPVWYPAGALDIDEQFPRDLRRVMIGDEHSVYLAGSPLYQGLPAVISSLVHRAGGTVVLVRDFDPTTVLAAIERHGITHTMVAPSLMTNLSKLNPEVRLRYDVSTLRGVLHDMAPCPPATKRAMIEWLGPIVNELYGASDVGGFTFITADEWLAHPGSVGRAVVGNVVVVNDDQEPLPAGEVGEICFGELDLGRADDEAHLRALRRTGDLGYLDDSGYLYHVDRRANAAVIGDQTWYPEQIEHVVIAYHRVADVVVIGPVDGGAELTAVVQPVWGVAPSADLARELLEYYHECAPQSQREAPLRIQFTERLPRAATGKIYRNQIRIS